MCSFSGAINTSYQVFCTHNNFLLTLSSRKSSAPKPIYTRASHPTLSMTTWSMCEVDSPLKGSKINWIRPRLTEQFVWSSDAFVRCRRSDSQIKIQFNGILFSSPVFRSGIKSRRKSVVFAHINRCHHFLSGSQQPNNDRRQPLQLSRTHWFVQWISLLRVVSKI